MRQVEWARELARKVLERHLPRRWEHSQGVGRRAESLAPILGKDAEILAASAWLHDIGYALELIDTGFHPIDGGRYLRDVHGADELLCRLVAHHTCAEIEAGQRGLLDILTGEFPKERGDLVEALTFCDMTTSPDGLPLTVMDRLAEIRSRYGPDDEVTWCINRAEPHILSAVRSVETRLALSDVRLDCLV
ncbi:HDIG domain-containing protein [Acrocarpospora macrocephala]|uniref:Metal-dependent phosphohydrolase, HD subdomain protein n=1 Tax=Acrocarpospora macrocephala TaxID=150177 RepID=A0A5M3WKF6_9ACTN|nr:HD domain-containing protein [Acrocarpospora macrocephala]GES07543.1 metal-dependent phosphohydrolase, HD subdomain protein [Acrocarpospora macrocephala]